MNYNSQYPDTVDLVVHRTNIINLNSFKVVDDNISDLNNYKEETVFKFSNDNNKDFKFMTLDMLGSI